MSFFLIGILILDLFLVVVEIDYCNRKLNIVLGDLWLVVIIFLKFIEIIDLGDYEFEFVVVIGKIVKNVIEVEVMDYVLGYIVVNDIFSREY